MGKFFAFALFPTSTNPGPFPPINIIKPLGSSHLTTWALYPRFSLLVLRSTIMLSSFPFCINKLIYSLGLCSQLLEWNKSNAHKKWEQVINWRAGWILCFSYATLLLAALPVELCLNIQYNVNEINLQDGNKAAQGSGQVSCVICAYHSAWAIRGAQ